MSPHADAAVEVRLPRCWRGVVGALGEPGTVRAVHPRTDCRQLEAALAIALSASAELGRDVWVAAPPSSRRRLEHLARTWARRAGGSVEPGGLLVVGASRVWVDEPLERGVAAAVVVDVHAWGADPREGADDPPERSLLIGEPLGRGHWARRCQQREPIRIPSAEVPGALRGRPPERDEVLELEEQAPAILRFARERLKVRSDKPREFLSPHQQEQAREQLGDGWWGGRSGTPTVSLELTRMQRRYLAAKRRTAALGRPARFLLLKYRRGGFTTLEQAESYRAIAASPNVMCLTVAHTMESTRKIMKIAETMHANDPRAPARSNDSATTIELENGSSLYIGTAGGKGVSRGDTLRRVHGSEVAKWCLGPNQAADVDDLVAGLIGAAQHGEVVLETTPNGSEWFCHKYREAKRGLNDWTPLFLPWYADRANRAAEGSFDPEEVVETLDAEESTLLEREGLTPAQVAWRRAAKRSYGRLFRQEFPEDDESCFLTSGLCYFDVELLTRLLAAGLPPPVERREGKGFRRTVWERPQPGVEYVAGCDTSEGIPGCDPCGVGVLRRDGLAQVASVHGYLPPAALADEAAALCREYNDALLGVERQNHGHAVLARLREVGFDRPHFRGGSLFYFRKGSDLSSSRPGWDTNESTRDLMLADLAKALEDGMVVRDPDFVQECLTFRLQHGGKWEADPGAHDDSVVKWAIARQMARHRRSAPKVTVV